MAGNERILLWFRRDFRLRDNRALAAALEGGHEVLPVYLDSREEEGPWVPGGAARVWLHHALEALGRDLAAHGLPLVLRRGRALDELRALVAETGATGVFWNRRYEPAISARDGRVKRALREDGLEARSFNSSLLFEPHELATGEGRPYQVFTPFWKAAGRKPVPAPVAVDLRKLHRPERTPRSLSPADFDLLPGRDWGETILRGWEVGEAAAAARLAAFVRHDLADYKTVRDDPGADRTSRLSPYLHWGHLGPRQVWAAVQESGQAESPGGRSFLSEIGWREFAHHVLHHFPHTPEEPLRPNFRDFPWHSDPEVLRRWRKGLTGYPIVDAGLRQLWQEGWMHNRVRMIAASLLVKHLLHPWQDGARWFWDCLVDADLASNTLGWQWAGGCGADAAPYFRVFNPITQARKFDPAGVYIRRYVPELRGLPDEHLAAPWEAPAAVLDRAGVSIGGSYPAPIVDHQEGRDRALRAFEAVKA